MKPILFIILITMSVIAEEPTIPGTILATVIESKENILIVDWEGNAKRPKTGAILSIEWGDGQYFTEVLRSTKNRIVVDYFPTSTTIDGVAIVRLFSGKCKH